MRLGNYTFNWKPDKITPVQRIKPFGQVNTYSGSAIFQWTPLLQGVPIVLEWDMMEEDQYQQLKIKFLSTSVYEFNPDNRGQSYNVIVRTLNGKYIDTVNNEQPYRLDVQLVMVIESAASTSTTTTSSSSTTTTTTA